MKSCPRLTFNVEKQGEVEVSIKARVGDRMVGRAMLTNTGTSYYVSTISVASGFPLRCGVGTRLYERALAFACKEKKPLLSDDLRTAASDGFWQKQVAKGRAQCIKPAFVGDEASMRRLMKVPSTTAAYGRSGCVQYRFNGCGYADLNGRRRRLRR